MRHPTLPPSNIPRRLCKPIHVDALTSVLDVRHLAQKPIISCCCELAPDRCAAALIARATCKFVSFSTCMSVLYNAPDGGLSGLSSGISSKGCGWGSWEGPGAPLICCGMAIDEMAKAGPANGGAAGWIRLCAVLRLGVSVISSGTSGCTAMLHLHTFVAHLLLCSSAPGPSARSCVPARGTLTALTARQAADRPLSARGQRWSDHPLRALALESLAPT